MSVCEHWNCRVKCVHVERIPLQVDARVTDNDLTPRTGDNQLVKKLKTQYARQMAIHEATCKTLMDVMSQKFDQSKHREDKADLEVSCLRNELKEVRLQLRRSEENSVSVDVLFCYVAGILKVICSQKAAAEEAVRSALSKHGATQQAAFVNELEQDILSKLNVSFEENECTVEEEVKKAVDAAKAEASKTAQAVREKHKEKVTSLCNRIAQLKRELKVFQVKCRANFVDVALFIFLHRNQRVI